MTSSRAVLSSMDSRHPTWRQPYLERALLPDTPQLKSYLFRLMAHKKTNLCLSADVNSTSELLDIANECGDYICLLKTHADTVYDFGDRTIRGLVEIAERKKFLLFEDRKFGDIGNTVQAQYAAGPHRIAEWATITNAHAFPGPAIVTSLKEAALNALVAYNSSISTEISSGGWNDNYFGRSTALNCNYDDEEKDESASAPSTARGSLAQESFDIAERPHAIDMRKSSIVSISTTISASTEYNNPPAHQHPHSYPASPFGNQHSDKPPLARGLLLLAQMSSANNLLTPEYTDKCIEMARKDADFAIGFIAQESLNRAPKDNFIVMTPGVSLPPLALGIGSSGSGRKAEDSLSPPASPSSPTSTSPGASSKRTSIRRPKPAIMARMPVDLSSPAKSQPAEASGKAGLPGDGKGQQYNTPRHVVLNKGVDIIIVGRGILNADDRGAEAERYRREGWQAYLDRIDYK